MIRKDMDKNEKNSKEGTVLKGNRVFEAGHSRRMGFVAKNIRFQGQARNMGIGPTLGIHVEVVEENSLVVNEVHCLRPALHGRSLKATIKSRRIHICTDIVLVRQGVSLDIREIPVHLEDKTRNVRDDRRIPVPENNIGEILYLHGRVF